MAANADVAQSWIMGPDGSFCLNVEDRTFYAFNCHRFSWKTHFIKRGSASPSDDTLAPHTEEDKADAIDSTLAAGHGQRQHLSEWTHAKPLTTRLIGVPSGGRSLTIPKARARCREVGVIDVGSNRPSGDFDGAARSPHIFLQRKIMAGLGAGMARNGPFRRRPPARHCPRSAGSSLRG
jgi:hypothetical protein